MQEQTKEKDRIALVEIAGSHDECLMTQMLALRSVSAHVTWITGSAMYARCAHLHSLIDDVHIVDVEGKAWGDFRKVKRIVAFLTENQISKVVFNTAQGGHVRNLAMLMPKNIRCYGIIHTLRKFQDSFTQKIISKTVKNYVVLSDDLLAKTKIPEGIRVGTFYPVDFPHFDTQVDKPEDETWITLTGGMETRRKDLAAMMDILHQTPEKVRFIFLGKTDLNDPGAQTFIHDLKNQEMTNRVVWFDDFVSQEQFDAFLRQTDFLLPLIHPDTPSSEQYIRNQISGAFLLSFSYQIPLLIHHRYEQEKDLRESSWFYDIATFDVSLEHAINHRIQLHTKIANEPKWKPEFQHRNFLRFIEVLPE